MIVKPLVLALIVLLQPRPLSAGPTSLIEWVREARQNDQELFLALPPEGIAVSAKQTVSPSARFYGRTTHEITLMAGLVVDSTTRKGDSDTFCTLNVWRGLMRAPSGAPEGTFEFRLSGTLQIADAKKKRYLHHRPVSKTFERTEFEVSLWPTQRSSSDVEKSVFSMDVTIKTPLPKIHDVEITTETLKKCFGPSTSVFVNPK